jgi:cell division protein FtsQ
MAQYIIKNQFWMSQVEQLDITPQYTFEMVPTIGNHIVKLGDGNDIDKKFNRLFIFYKEILSKTGFDKYSILDAQYKGQLIATKKQ